MRKHLAPLFVALVIVVAAVSCGGGDDSPSSPTPTPAPAPSPTPRRVARPRSRSHQPACRRGRSRSPHGGRVNFVNNDTRVHDMSSNPHPAHTDCPAINQAGFLQPGQSRETGNLTTPRTCGFHDHNRDTDTSLQGTIVIQ